MKKVLILHGRGGDDQENWFPWLKKELESKGYKVFVPILPNTNNPNLKEQLDYISDYNNNVGKFDYIVGHSLGCKLALLLIEKYDLSGIKCILVGPVYKGMTEELGKSIYGNAYKNLKEYVDSDILYKKLGNEYTIFLSDNDPYIKVESAKKYYKELESMKFVNFKGRGHFNEGAGIYKLPEIFEYIK